MVDRFALGAATALGVHLDEHGEVLSGLTGAQDVAVGEHHRDARHLRSFELFPGRTSATGIDRGGFRIS
jgi:hypothetical protein